jgi:hypothetical protein
VVHGLGSENRNLPGFIVFIAGETGRAGVVEWFPAPRGFRECRESGGVPDLNPPAGVDAKARGANSN